MAAAPDSVRRAQPLLGTFVEIAAAGTTAPALEAAVEAAFAAVATVHRLMSFHEADSDVSRLNRGAASGAVQVNGWTYQVLETAVDLNRRSGGVFDVTIAPALRDMGVLPRMRPLPSGSIHLLPENRVRFSDRCVAIDLGGIAKGFAVDRAIAVLRRHGVTDGLVNAGGDLAAFGAHPCPVDIRDPRHPDRAMCRISVSNAALASSARRFDPLRSARPAGCAIIAPATGLPVRAIHGATVRAPGCMIADALTEIVMNTGEAGAPLLEAFGARALFVSAQGEVHVTADWNDEVRFAA
jgi:thiamine biosynthesis lipoprotein